VSTVTSSFWAAALFVSPASALAAASEIWNCSLIFIPPFAVLHYITISLVNQAFITILFSCA
jgi:hypothetical protein